MRLHLRRPRPLPLVLAVAALGLAGCGSNALDMQQTEDDIGASLRQRTGMQITAVDCPEDVRARKGGRFTCVARLPAGKSAPIRVVQSDDDGTMRYSVGP